MPIKTVRIMKNKKKKMENEMKNEKKLLKIIEKKENYNKDIRFGVRLTEKEYRFLENVAKKSNMSVSKVVRIIIDEYLNK